MKSGKLQFVRIFVQWRLSSQTLNSKQADNQAKKRPKLGQRYVKEGAEPFFTYLFNGNTVS
ncbi:MAG TPA: hypothetical protein DCR43_06930 [Bacteroidales bacterium]|nr:MAG: hypothetical protein A2X11_16400 [Bacteroidetes bacterium GWE2_42_24]OFY26369.1 MAG: hypothetical protein A2X09_00290 [Bacteroidetes bacterium GWF2_43_11]HAQ65568.1 hypothetical protein [Bacteroidales bacterium]HBZ66871.1 hypothetical protein [Bacteroidales bacterium]